MTPLRMKEEVSRPLPRRPLWRRCLTTFGIIVVIIEALLLFEHHRGHRILAEVRRDMEKRGQISDIHKLPNPSPGDLDVFINQLAPFMRSIDHEFFYGGGNLIQVAPGVAARGSQAPFPARLDKINLIGGKASFVSQPTNTWEMVEEKLRPEEEALAKIRDLIPRLPLTGSPRAMDLKNRKASHVVVLRRASQSFNDAVLLALHRGSLPDAEKNLLAMVGLMGVNRDSPELIDQLVRASLSGLASSMLWDAVQAEGWTDPQLERLQKAFQEHPFLPGVVRAIHFERLNFVDVYEQARQMTYRDWQGRILKWMSVAGIPRSPMPPALEKIRHYVFHPLWRYAWAEQEMAAFLRRTDFWSALNQESLRKKAFANHPQEWNRSDVALPLPFPSWRFYLVSPIGEWKAVAHVPGGKIASAKKPATLWEQLSTNWSRNDFELANYSSSIVSHAAKNEVIRQMAVTSLALRRYQIREGKFPERLELLVPAYLAELPVDWMDGKPLRYHSDPDGGYTLYSVGEDGKDDGGDATEVSKTVRGFAVTKDLVWSKTVPWER